MRSTINTHLRHLIPVGLKHWVLLSATRFVLPDAKPDRIRASKGRVTVAGLLSSPSGIGEAARLTCERLASFGYSVGAIDLTDCFRLPGGVRFKESAVQIGDVGGPLIVQLNPPAFEVALLRFLRANRVDRKLIASWAWELAHVPAAWKNAFRLAHEIWVPSTFVAEALRSSGCRTDVRVVPYPMPVPEISVTAGVDESPLMVLTVFAYDSGFERKNPIGAIAAFRKAFAGDATARLVLKSRGRSLTGKPEERLVEAIGDAQNIEILHGDLSRDSYRDLVRSCDVFLSMHRAEGFGIPLAEAMLHGKPVIATKWSGNLDFMTERSAFLVPGTMTPVVDETEAFRGINETWADPDVEVAAEFLRQLRERNLRRHLGAAAREHAISFVGPGAFAAAIAGAV